MSISTEDLEMVQRVNTLLQEGKTLPQVAVCLKIAFPTLYQAIRRAGYKIETQRRLVPTNAPELNSN